MTPQPLTDGPRRADGIETYETGDRIVVGYFSNADPTSRRTAKRTERSLLLAARHAPAALEAAPPDPWAAEQEARLVAHAGELRGA